MRKPIFDTIRAQRGQGFTPDEVKAVDALLDRLGFERDEEETPVPQPLPDPVIVAPANGSVGLDNPKAFFDAVRESHIFGRGLTPDQVSGMETVCGVSKAAGWPIAFTAYALATAAHETAYKMQPVREAFWLDENWRRVHLRKYFPFYGRGYVQLTWRENYERADRELELGGRLTSNLDVALDPDIAAKIMVRGMQEGWFAADRKTGKRHTLALHLPANGPAKVAQMVSARRIINGTDKNREIADVAMKFQNALQAGGW